MDTLPHSKEHLAEIYVPRSTLYDAGKIGLQSAGVGVLVSAVQNALATHNAGAAGIFTRTGGTIGFFAAMGATFAFADGLSANIREKEDPVNGFVGGCSAGVLAGLRAKSLPTAVLGCIAMGGLVATFDATGKSIARETNGPDDLLARRRKFFKKPPPFLDHSTQNPQTES